MRKRLVYRADDIGYTKTFNDGAFKAIENGIVTSADVMLDTPGSVDALERLRDYPWISVGWHSGHLWGSAVADPRLVPHMVDGTGIYGALDAGMTGNHSVLIAKSVLDFFTAMIFACKLGKATALIGIPQGMVLLALFALAKVIVPLTTDTMVADFKACGGFILVATGLRMMKVKAFPIADMIPAMVLVMPVSFAWVNWILPLIG